MTSTADVPPAIAAKLQASAGCAAAGLRKADTNEGDPLTPPHIRVGNVSWEITDRPVGNAEYLRLTVKGTLLVQRPDGSKRKQATVDAIAQAVRVEFQSGVKLGLAPFVDECWLVGFDADDMGDYADTELIGGTFTWLIDVTDTLATARTA